MYIDCKCHRKGSKRLGPKIFVFNINIGFQKIGNILVEKNDDIKVMLIFCHVDETSSRY
jgi:hypothetical protein